MVCSISSARPITGSSWPSRARAVRSMPNLSSIGVAESGCCSCRLAALPPGLGWAWAASAALACCSACGVTPMRGQDLAGRGFLVQDEREEQMLRINVGGAKRAGHLVRIQQGALGRGG